MTDIDKKRVGGVDSFDREFFGKMRSERSGLIRKK